LHLEWVDILQESFQYTGLDSIVTKYISNDVPGKGLDDEPDYPWIEPVRSLGIVLEVQGC
jgi:hypothetical protein